MFPDIPRFSAHSIEGTWRCVQGEPLPSLTDLSTKTKFAGRQQRNAEYFIKVRLVSMPADPGPGFVFSDKNLPYFSPVKILNLGC